MEGLTILDLNDDCLRHIFNYLGIKDLINLADNFSRFRHILLEMPAASFPVYHWNDPQRKKPVLYYTRNAINILRAVKDDIVGLNIIEGGYYDYSSELYSEAVENLKVLTDVKNKICLRDSPGGTPRPSDETRYLSISVPFCICYLEEFFQLVPNLQKLLLPGRGGCSNCFGIILKLFPKLNRLWILRDLKLRSDFEMISQISSLTDLSVNIDGRHRLAPLANLSELESLDLKSDYPIVTTAEIIKIIQNCKKLLFIYCSYINYGQNARDSIGNFFKRIKEIRCPCEQEPLQL
ncbi:hypothetical protein KR084_009199, partial [Drosophila pseudotakahashii]